PADDGEDQVLARDPLGQAAGEDEADGRRHLEPGHAGGHARRHVGGTHAGGKGPPGAVGAGVAVRADDAVAGGDDALFGQQGVLDAHLAHVVEVEDVVLVGKLPALLGLGGALDVLVGDEVVQDDGHPLFVEHAVKTGLLELVDGHRGGDVVAQDDVQFGVDELARLDLVEAGMVCKDLLRQSHSHDTVLLHWYVFGCLFVVDGRDQGADAGHDDVGIGAGAPGGGAVTPDQPHIRGGPGGGPAVQAVLSVLLQVEVHAGGGLDGVGHSVQAAVANGHHLAG